MIECFGLLIMGFGGLMIFKSEWMWRLRTWENAFRGVKSERTKTWEIGNKLLGVLFVVIGIGVIIYGFFTPQANLSLFSISPFPTQVPSTPTPVP